MSGEQPPDAHGFNAIDKGIIDIVVTVGDIGIGHDVAHQTTIIGTGGCDRTAKIAVTDITGAVDTPG